MSYRLPEPGIDDYLPILIDCITEHPALSNWQFDASIFWLVLLALIARRGGVVIDLAESHTRRRLMPGVVSSARAVAESIFGLDTHAVHLDSSTLPEDIRDLILDRRKRSLRFLPEEQSTYPLSHTQSTPIPARPISRSGLSTQYHSAESVLPTSPALSLPLDLENEDTSSSLTGWPDVLVVSGLEDCDSPTQNKLWQLIKLSGKERDDGRQILLVWVRREEKSAGIPAWLADHFILSGEVYAEEMERPPRLHRQCLVSSSYIDDLAALLPYTHIHPTLSQQLNNLVSATSADPNLQSVLTGRFLSSLPTLVRASRLLTGGFTLPPEWQANLARLSRPDQADAHRFGLGGGAGGVDGWARKAGQEPNLAELGEGGEGWFVELRDVKAIWRTVIRHRVRWRGLSESVMWNLKTNAADLVRTEALSAGKQGRQARRQREEVDRRLDDMITML